MLIPCSISTKTSRSQKHPGNLIPGNNLFVFGDQEDEKFERLPLKLEPAAFAAELRLATIEAEVAELIDDKGHCPPRSVAEV